jgi:3'(2'), 5'-bisphosphate nucleotidase
MIASEQLATLSIDDVVLNRLVPAVMAAGEAIMKVKQAGFDVEQKSDHSPVTQADKAANAILLDALSQFYPEIDVISEEAEDSHRLASSQRYFLVDPLDGTKEFIRPDSKGNFTVNIGLVLDGQATGGIVYAPMRDMLFVGVANEASYLVHNQQCHLLDVDKPVASRPHNRTVALASRSHMDEHTRSFLEQHQIEDVVSVGSSVKFGYLAMGEADIYPRFAPTCEWDTAAGEAVLRGAGGYVTDATGNPHRYGKPSWLNNPFIAYGRFPSS